MDLRGKKVLVLGLGISGRSAVEFCAARGAVVTAADERELRKLPDGGEIEALARTATLVCGSPFPDAGDFELTIPSPGIPPARYRPSAREVWGDVELAGRALAIPVIAVTGTNGKSTTVRLIEAMLKAAGLRARAAGNLGTAALSLVGQPLDVAVLEISSFQLETTQAFRPRVAVILNISPDHLDRHGSLEQYAEAKRRILKAQQTEDVAVLNFDDPIVRGFAPSARGSVIPFSGRGRPAAPGHPRAAWLDAGAARFADLETSLGISLDSITGLGAHDRENVLAALSAIWALGVDPERGAEALLDFRPLPHRCEVLGTLRGITWVNDSKATNPGAALRAMESIDAPLIWIAGGSNKGLSFDWLAREAERRVRTALLIGEAASELEAALKGRVACQRADGLDDAVALAAEKGRPGDVVLLAPACASFDQFEDFEHRGECFREAFGRIRGERMS